MVVIMNLNDNEKKVLKELVKNELKSIDSEEKTIIETSPGFFKGEIAYDQFLKDLIKKLGE